MQLIRKMINPSSLLYLVSVSTRVWVTSPVRWEPGEPLSENWLQINFFLQPVHICLVRRTWKPAYKFVFIFHVLKPPKSSISSMSSSFKISGEIHIRLYEYLRKVICYYKHIIVFSHKWCLFLYLILQLQLVSPFRAMVESLWHAFKFYMLSHLLFLFFRFALMFSCLVFHCSLIRF